MCTRAALNCCFVEPVSRSTCYSSQKSKYGLDLLVQIILSVTLCAFDETRTCHLHVIIISLTLFSYNPSVLNSCFPQALRRCLPFRPPLRHAVVSLMSFLLIPKSLRPYSILFFFFPPFLLHLSLWEVSV